MRLVPLVLLSLWSLSAQQFPDAAALLAQESAAVRNYQTLQYTDEMTMDIAGLPTPVASTTVMQFAGGKFRMVSTASGMEAVVVVFDGKTAWTYSPIVKQYTRQSDAPPESPVETPVTENAKVLRSEFLDLVGQNRDCWVIEIRPTKGELQDAVLTYWLDKTLGLMLQSTTTGKPKTGANNAEVHMKTARHGFKFNEALPDSVFTFTPPADAKETAELFPGMKPAATKEAPPATTAPAPGEPEAFIPSLKHDPVEPVLPKAVKVSGMVELLVTVDPTGRVTKAEALTGPALLRQPAIETVRQYRYRPAVRDGHPVAAYTQEMVDFTDPDKPDSAPAFDLAEQMASSERLAELQSKFPRTPGQVLSDTEQNQDAADSIEHFYALPSLAKAALDAGDLDKATTYANELLHLAAQDKPDWNYGNAIYDGNMVLGMVALRQGSIVQARHHLLESGKTPGSPQLNSFGPDLRLAQELLKKGERDTVLEFLTECRTFWKMGAAKLDRLAESVRSGGTI